MADSNYQFINRPGRIGNLETKNRIVLPAMHTGYAADEGYISERFIQYYRERALGGVGLIITEICAVIPFGGPRFCVADDSYVTGLKQFADSIHETGAKIALQLWHGGMQRKADSKGLEVVGPSPMLPFPEINRGVPMPAPRELAISEIKAFPAKFVDGARRAKQAGFDAVEIHGAHQYLISQFLSRAANKRTDEYGGSLENRARFLLEIVRAVRTEVGPDFPFWCRLNGQEFGIKEGNTIEDIKQVVTWAQAAGVNAVHISAQGILPPGNATLPVKSGVLLGLAAEVKKVAKVPVITVGRLDDDLAEKTLAAGGADFVSIGRRTIADPHYHVKMLSGRSNEVTPCIACNECIDFLQTRNLSCTVNPAVGTNFEAKLPAASKPKTVVVVGGGPAGMEAAITASKRGHRVTLIEKTDKLGGLLNLAVIPPDKEDLGLFFEYQKSSLKTLPVVVEMSHEATVAKIEHLKPDAVVIATGSTPQKLQITMESNPPVMSAEEILTGKAATGNTVVVIGGGLVGCEVAHFLVKQGKTVTIVELLDGIAMRLGTLARLKIIIMLMSNGIKAITGARCETLKGKELVITKKDSTQETLIADTFVVATGYRADQQLYKEIKDKYKEVYLVGDASEPRNLGDAMREGFNAALKI